MSTTRIKHVDISTKDLRCVVCFRKTIIFYYYDESKIELEFENSDVAMNFYKSKNFLNQDLLAIVDIKVVGIKMTNSNTGLNENPS